MFICGIRSLELLFPKFFAFWSYANRLPDPSLLGSGATGYNLGWEVSFGRTTGLELGEIRVLLIPGLLGETL